MYSVISRWSLLDLVHLVVVLLTAGLPLSLLIAGLPLSLLIAGLPLSLLIAGQLSSPPLLPAAAAVVDRLCGDLCSTVLPA